MGGDFEKSFVMATSKELQQYKKYYGPEPSGPFNNVASLIRAYSWYEGICDSAEAKEWLVEYATKNYNHNLKAVKAVNLTHISRAACWSAKMLLNGMKLPESVVDKLHNYLDSLTYEADEPEVSTPKAKVQDSDPLISEIEDQIDRFMNGETTITFNIYEALKNGATKEQARKVITHYKPWLEELELIGKNPDVKEGYSRYSKAQVKIFRDFASEIVGDCERFLSNAKKARKPRKAKAKSANQILRHFKYMKAHDKLKIQSVNPEQIIGAKQLFVLNTKNNVLTMFVAKDGGLGVNRTAITNYDEKLTKSKRVGRKVETVIASVLNGTKREREGVFDKVSSDYINTTDRMNDATVLLKAVK